MENLTSKKVLIRVDFNVPVENGQISDDLRLVTSLPTITHVLKQRPKSVVLVSHFGRPKGVDSALSLKVVLPRLQELLNQKVTFASDINEAQKLVDAASDSSVILLENIRFESGETKNDKELSARLAKLCEVYINDAFGACHRTHASTVGICEFIGSRFVGLLLDEELRAFNRVIKTPERPLWLIVGGAKVSTKLKLLKNILKLVDGIIIGGAMSNTFLKAKGFDMKSSLLEDDLLDEAKEILKNDNIILPVDVITKEGVLREVGALKDGEAAYDIGAKSIELFNVKLKGVKTIVWNGPLGAFESPLHKNGTFEVAKFVSNSGAYSLVGGGDIANAIKKAGCKMSFVSTGGGAGLWLLEGAELPALRALKC